MYIGSCMSTTQKNVLFKLMKAFTRPQRVPDSYENITVKIRFIHFEHLKIESNKYLVVGHSWS